MRRSLFRLSAACALFAAFAWATPVVAQDYPFDIAKADPAALSAWRAVVPRQYRRQAWIYSFAGVAGPLQRVTMRHKVFYYGSVCIPHDCGGNFVAFLVAADGSEAAGLLASQTLGVKHQYFGAPDAEARSLLERKIGK